MSTPGLVLERGIQVRLLLIVGGLPALLLTGQYAIDSIKHGDNVTGVVLGALTLLSIGLLPRTFWREGRREIRLFEDRIEEEVDGDLESIAFDQVDQVWLSARSAQIGWALGGLIGSLVGNIFIATTEAVTKTRGQVSDANTSMTVRLVAGRQNMKFNSNYKGVARGLEFIYERVNPRLLEASFARLDGPEGLTFGRVKLTARGIRLGSNKLIPWTRVKKVRLKGGRLYVDKKRSLISKGGIPIKWIPNVAILIELATWLIEEHAVSPPVTASSPRRRDRRGD